VRRRDQGRAPRLLEARRSKLPRSRRGVLANDRARPAAHGNAPSSHAQERMNMLSASSPVTTPRVTIHSLGNLAARSRAELDGLYRAANAPTTMRGADGALHGRMLAIRGVPAVLAAPLRRFAASPSFVWDGKTFESSTETRGTGFNRVHIPRLLGRQSL